MILHAAELWLALAVCFVGGCFAGSLCYRAIRTTSARLAQSRLAHGIDRTSRIVEWRVLPWRSRPPLPLPRVVAVPPPDYRHAEAVEPLPPLPLPLPIGELLEPDPHLPAPVYEPVTMLPAAVPGPGRDAIGRADAAGIRPLPLSAPRQGRPDPLWLIRGVGKRHAAKLASIGIFHFSQIASWTPQEARWIAAWFDIGEAVTEKDWIGQATVLGSTDDPEAMLAEAKAAKPARKLRSKRGRTRKAADVAPAPAEAETATGSGDAVEEKGDR